MDKKNQSEALVITRQLCHKYGLTLSSVGVRKKNSSWGTAIIRSGRIIYAASLFKQSKAMILKTVCHELAHLLAAKRHGKNCNHNRHFQACETEIDALYGIKPVYLRSRGYAAAYMDLATGEFTGCKPGYKIKNGRVVVDSDRRKNDKIIRKVMRAALKAGVFPKKQVFDSIVCETLSGHLALTISGGRDKTVLFQSGIKTEDFSAALGNVKHTGRALRYVIKQNSVAMAGPVKI